MTCIIIYNKKIEKLKIELNVHQQNVLNCVISMPRNITPVKKKSDGSLHTNSEKYLRHMAKRKKQTACPGQCGSVGWASTHKEKGCWSDFPVRAHA